MNISSVMGRVSGRGYLAYGIAKAALAHWTRLASKDLAPLIRVNAIGVGSVMTSALEFVASDEAVMREMAEKTTMQRVGEVEDIAAAVVYLASPASAYLTGKVIEADGGLDIPNLDLRLPDLRRPERTVSAPRGGSSPGRPAPWAGTRSPASTPGPTSSWSGCGSRTRTRSARTPAGWPGWTATSACSPRTTSDALFALEPDAIVHTAMTDDRIFEALEDLCVMVEHGINVVSSGPVLLTFPAGLGLDSYVDRIAAAGAETGASLHVNGIDPGFANDVLPLAMTSLSQRIDLVRVSEIADYSTYYQPVVMRDIYGFGRPMDQVAMLWQPGILTTAWGPVVRHIAAGLDLELDPELEENVERVPSEVDLQHRERRHRGRHHGRGPVQVVGKVDGCAGPARPRHPHRGRPDARSGRSRPRAGAATGWRSRASR